MKEFGHIGFQGDVCFIRVKEIPQNAVQKQHDGRVVVAYSETHHDHAIESKAISHFEVPGDSLVAYLRFDVGFDSDAGGVNVVHHRSWDQHETVRLLGKAGDVWQVRRQREWAPEGWRRTQD